MPFGMESLLLGLGFAHTVSIESEHGEGVGFASSVDRRDVMTAHQGQTKRTLIWEEGMGVERLSLAWYRIMTYC